MCAAGAKTGLTGNITADMLVTNAILGSVWDRSVCDRRDSVEIIDTPVELAVPEKRPRQRFRRPARRYALVARPWLAVALLAPPCFAVLDTCG